MGVLQDLPGGIRARPESFGSFFLPGMDGGGGFNPPILHCNFAEEEFSEAYESSHERSMLCDCDDFE